MKTFLPLLKAAIRTVGLFLLLIVNNANAQVSTASVLANGLNFDNPQRLTVSDLEPGSEYLFSGVITNIDAKVRIDSLVNGASINKIDDNSNGTGYKAAFQPAIQCGGVLGMSYAVFTISFFQQGTSNPVSLPVANATPIDIDGNNSLKEFAQINMGNSAIVNYMMASPDILVETTTGFGYMGKNMLGIERNNIDTASLANMFTVSNVNVSSFTVKYGAITSNTGSAVRQYSLYLKNFNYPGNTLPVKLLSFTALLNNNKAELNWRTTAEINLDRFIVERSTDGVNFTDAGLVFATGGASDETNYKLTDNLAGLSSDVVYYRLRSIDKDGKQQLSEVRMIRLSKKLAETITVLTYPNPVNNELHITIPAAWQHKQVVYEIFSLTGQLVNKSVSANAGQTEIKNIYSLQSGMYSLRVSCEGKIGTQKIIKL